MPELDNDTRPGLAFVANSITPYGVNLQRSIAAGIPELKLHVLVTHSPADFKWNIDIPPEIHLQHIGADGESPLENPLRRPLQDWQKGGRLIRYMRENKIRAVIIIGYRFLSLLRLMNYCYRSGIPFFVNQDSNIRSEPPLSSLQSFIKCRLYAWWMKRASGVMSMGALGDQFFIKYGADPQQLYRVPCWPDYESFSRVDEVHLARFRQQFGLDERRYRILYSGRLVPEKRVDLLIDAFAAVADLRPDWDLLVVGDGVLRDELERRVPDGLRSRVVWTGFLDREELVLAYHAADVLVLPSDHEPWALVVQEAMAAGLTVVASDVVGAAHELVVDGVSGKIFAKGDCASLRTALEDITDPARVEAYRQQAIIALGKYREQVDPVAEIRRALRDADVLSSEPPRQFNTTVNFKNAQ